jgi:hypothetical protein
MYRNVCETKFVCETINMTRARNYKNINQYDDK